MHSVVRVQGGARKLGVPGSRTSSRSEETAEMTTLRYATECRDAGLLAIGTACAARVSAMRGDVGACL